MEHTVKSILSAGEIINDLLTDDADVMHLAGKIYPVVEDEAILPYIVYRRLSLTDEAVKARQGAKTALIEVLCFSDDYVASVEMAEAVSRVLDGASAVTDDGLTMRSCHLHDSSEAWQDDAFIQRLIFEIKI